MRIENIKVKISLNIPFGRPDKNGVIYSKEAVEKAISSFNREMPIVYRDNDMNKYGAVIGTTTAGNYSVLWDNEHQVCNVIVGGSVFYGGTECVVNDIKDGIVEDFDIVSVGLSK